MAAAPDAAFAGGCWPQVSCNEIGNDTFDTGYVWRREIMYAAFVLCFEQRERERMRMRACASWSTHLARDIISYRRSGTLMTLHS